MWIEFDPMSIAASRSGAPRTTSAFCGRGTRRL
jgi:hypothetical protein